MLGVCHSISHWERVCHRTGNPTIDACFDADRIDLMRVGIIPNPKRMTTMRGAFCAANMERFYAMIDDTTEKTKTRLILLSRTSWITRLNLLRLSDKRKTLMKRF